MGEVGVVGRNMGQLVESRRRSDSDPKPNLQILDKNVLAHFPVSTFETKSKTERISEKMDSIPPDAAFPTNECHA